MKKIFLSLVIFSLVNTLVPAQTTLMSDNIFILPSKKKTKVNINEKGELIVTVSEKDAAKFKADGIVSYKVFGAKGDGKTDDIDAIAAAHAYANQEKLAVKADEGTTFYIGGKNRTAIIETDTDFGTAAFIIDDTAVEKVNSDVFRVVSEKKSIRVKGITSLKKNQQKIDATFPETCLISVTNWKVKQFIRMGRNQNDGASQTDIFVVDKDGNVDMRNPIIWDFDQITQITALPIDETKLTIKGGRFTTIANKGDVKDTYYSRGIELKRSNVLVDGIEHRITGEGEFGSPYRGFISMNECANITVQNTKLTGHKVYSKIGNAGLSVPMGSYDIHANRSLSVSLLNCQQLNDINDGKYWGIFASNFCKNILFDNCSFSRFDAHMGVTNAIIRNSTLGHQGINAIGFGTLLVENTTVNSRNLMNLREDYGSTFQGEFIFRNCVFAPRGNNLSSINLVGGSNSGNHNFGYTCYMPERITIENLKIEDSKVSASYNGPTIFADFNPKMKDESYVEEFPYIKTKEVNLINVSLVSGKQIRTSDNMFMFKDVIVNTK